MFLNLNEKNSNDIAVIDDSKVEIPYGKLIEFSSHFYANINKRTLVFILSSNKIGSVAGYVACMSYKIVPLIIGSDTDIYFIKDLIATYNPEFLWLPEELKEEFNYQEKFSEFGFSLVETGLRGYPLYDHLSLLLSTSGSTGSPKFVRHTYENVERNAKNVSSFFEIETKHKAMAVLPMHYTMGLSVITSHLFAGATILLSDKNLTDRDFWSFIKEYKATSFTGVPFSYEILQKLRFFRMDLPHLELITQGGGKMSEKLFLQCATYAKELDKNFVATYGQTEGTARMAYLPSNMAIEKVGSIGKPIPEGKLYLVDDNDNRITEPYVEGELIYEGPNVTMGYATKGEDLILEDLNKGKLRTGDIAIVDSEGYFFIKGRKKRFLKLYGIRISLDELQELIKAKFNVDCVCSGDDKKMLIYITNQSLIDDVINFTTDKTKLFNRAFEVIYIEDIKRNSAGKVILV